MKNSHTELVNGLVVSLGQHPELGKFWKQATGVARSFDDPDRIIKFGLPGAADVAGIGGGAIAGIVVELECKTGKGVQSDEQKSFQFMIERHGGIYLVVRSIPQALSFLAFKCKI